jgi:hypothetical protein
LAAIVDLAGALTAIEITYLEPNGRRADRLRLPRKSIGVIRPSSAVRLDPLGPRLLVGEGVFSTLSASGDLDLPGWALLSTRNLRTWAPPTGVQSVMIAADRGRDGERSARILRTRLVGGGMPCDIAWPPESHGDWNEAAQASKPKGEGEGGFGRARRAG